MAALILKRRRRTSSFPAESDADPPLKVVNSARNIYQKLITLYPINTRQ